MYYSKLHRRIKHMTDKKTNRKNKTNQVVKWPAGYFTIKQLNEQNVDFVNITLRVRLNKAIEDKKVVELGVMQASKGRPNLVFACSPVDASVIESARTNGIILLESFNSVKVTTISGQPQTTPTTPASAGVVTTTSVNTVAA